MDIQCSESNNKPANKKIDINPLIVLPLLPQKRTADDPSKPLYVKKNWSKYLELWEKVNKKV